MKTRVHFQKNKWGMICELIEEQIFSKSKLCPEYFPQKCNKNYNVPQFIPQ